MAEEEGCKAPPLAQDEEKAVLMIRWQKLLKARDENEDLAVQRSYENGRYAMFVCCSQGKRRKKPPYDEGVSCDVCLGWVHRGCMSEHAWTGLGDTFICWLCNKLPPSSYELRSATKQNAVNEINENAAMRNAPIAQHEAETEQRRSPVLNPEDSLVEMEDEMEGDERSLRNEVAEIPPAGNDNPRDHPVPVQNLFPSDRETSRAKNSFESCGICAKSVQSSEYFHCDCGLISHTLCSYLIQPEPNVWLSCKRCQESSENDSRSSGSETTVVEVSSQKNSGASTFWDSQFPPPPNFNSTAHAEPAYLSCPCGKVATLSMLLCARCVRLWHLPCARNELRDDDQFVCALCSAETHRQRGALADSFLASGASDVQRGGHAERREFYPVNAESGRESAADRRPSVQRREEQSSLHAEHRDAGGDENNGGFHAASCDALRQQRTEDPPASREGSKERSAAATARLGTTSGR